MDKHPFNLARLRTELKPFRLHWFPRLASTNDHAGVLRKRGDLFAPAIVLTGKQIKGRGRGANSWWSGPGSLTVTFVLPIEDHLLPQQVPLIAGLAVRDAVVEITGVHDVQLKWPNDLLHGDRKLAGLLCERLDKVDLVGVGINVNVQPREVPPALRPRVTSISQIAGFPLDVNAVLVRIAHTLRQTLSRRDGPPFTTMLKEYHRHHALVGRRVTVARATDEPPVTGTCVGLDTAGRLLVRERASTARVVAGHVTMLPRG